MWDVSDTLGVLAQMFTDTGTILTATIATIVVAIVALLGLGFALRKTKEHITGSGFFEGHEVDKSKVNWEELDFRRRRGFGSNEM